MINKLARRDLIVIGVSMLIVAIGTTAPAFGAYWPAIAGLGILQVGILGVLMVQHKQTGGPASRSVTSPDALSTRLMAAVETERLDAIDRHRELLDALRGSIRPRT
jgi:hypothetical protein